jgi:hypothetical protein
MLGCFPTLREVLEKIIEVLKTILKAIGIILLAILIVLILRWFLRPGPVPAPATAGGLAEAGEPGGGQVGAGEAGEAGTPEGTGEEVEA